MTPRSFYTTLIQHAAQLERHHSILWRLSGSSRLRIADFHYFDYPVEFHVLDQHRDSDDYSMFITIDGYRIGASGDLEWITQLSDVPDTVLVKLALLLGGENG